MTNKIRFWQGLALSLAVSACTPATLNDARPGIGYSGVNQAGQSGQASSGNLSNGSVNATQPGNIPSNLVSGAAQNNPTPGKNRPPVVQFLNASPATTTRPEDIIRFETTAVDPDQDGLRYSWHATKGHLLNANGAQAQWQPLKTDGSVESGIAIVSVIVSDSKGGIDSSSANIRIDASGSSKQEAVQQTAVTVREVLLTQTELVLKAGDERQLDATVLLENGSFNKDVLWISSDESILQVSAEGLVRRLRPGEASLVALSKQDVSKKQILRVIESVAAPLPAGSAGPVLPDSSSPLPVPPLNENSVEQVLAQVQSLLLNAPSLSDRVDKESYKYYKLDVSSVPDGAQIAILLSPEGGDADLYLGKSPNVNSESFDLRSARTGIDEILIQKTSGTQQYYLAVYGFGGGGFRLRAQSSAPVLPQSQTAAPVVGAVSDISVVEKTTFYGKIFDDTEAPLDGVTVKAKSLNSAVPYEATSTTAGGFYAFNNAPAGVQIEIVASKPGYSNRYRVEVLKSNKVGDPNTNKYDFGSGTGSLGPASGALSDKPEVTSVTPGRNASGVNPDTSFVLKFSEPMDRATVVDNFEIRGFSSEKLNVDTSVNAFTLIGSGDVSTVGGSQIWDKSAFHITWNSDDTEVSFSFRSERSLPTDKDADKVPDYQVALERADKIIKDKSGVSRFTDASVPGNSGMGAFKLTDGNFERSYKFSIDADTIRPRVDSLVAQTSENGGPNSDGDAVKVRFSERMIHYTLAASIAGGMGGMNAQAPAAVSNGAVSVTAENAAANYKLTVVRGGVTLLDQVAWSTVAGGGGRAVFDANDPTHKTVLLLPPGGANLYVPGDNVRITVDPTLVDPAGNSVDPTGLDASANAS